MLFKFLEIHPGIFHLVFDDKIELISHFLRVQEFYESPKFQRQHFQLMDYIKWYIREGSEHKTNKYAFTYFDDFVGFNVPVDVVLECHAGITDMNDHDRFIHEIALKASKMSKTKKAYLIGTFSDSPGTLEHELAHGLYYLNQDYKNRALKCIVETNYELWFVLRDSLKRIGYCDDVIDDEFQAFMATGLIKRIEEDIAASGLSDILDEERQPFIKLFKESFVCDQHEL